jgi:hypothetical protein
MIEFINVKKEFSNIKAGRQNLLKTMMTQTSYKQILPTQALVLNR